jgi:hypothetical protein
LPLRTAASGGVGRLGVDTPSKRDRIELGVGRFFLVEIGRQEADHFVVIELLSGYQCSDLRREISAIAATSGRAFIRLHEVKEAAN